MIQRHDQECLDYFVEQIEPLLHDHPHVTQVSLCLDNDKAGPEGMERLENAIREDPELAQRVTLIYHNPPPVEYGKDYNEFLCAYIRAERQKQHQREVVL